MKAVLRGILSRLFYWGDETVARWGKFASANLAAYFFVCDLYDKREIVKNIYNFMVVKG